MEGVDLMLGLTGLVAMLPALGGPVIPVALSNIAARIPRLGTNCMTRESTDIEVEVVEVDGMTQAAPKSRPAHTSQRNDWQDWRKFSGKIRTLDSRWWPLWVILGTVALALFLTVGLLVGAVVLIVGLFMKLLRAILR
jgi:hypothetical protein